MKMNLKQIVPLGFGSIFILTAIGTAASQFSIVTLNAAREAINQAYLVRLELQALEKNLVDAETGQRGFLLTNNPSFLEPYTDSLSEIPAHFQNLEALLADTPQQQQKLEQLRAVTQQKQAELAQTINLKRAGRIDESLAIVISGEGKEYMDAIRAILAETIRYEEQNIAERQEGAQLAQRIVTVINYSNAILIVIVGCAAIVTINRIAIAPINLIVSNLAQSSSQIATAVEQQEQTASQQAAIVNETATTMDELNHSSRQSSEYATNAAANAQKTLELTEKGSQEVNESLQGMTLLQDKVNHIDTQIDQLKAQTQQIGSISQVVSELANQTNMLALNAAVEAARAGERGQGFAVVATEIRKLADRSNQSAQSINTLVSDIQNAIVTTSVATTAGRETASSGLKTAERTVQTFTDVAEAVTAMATNNQHISLNLKQQLDAIQQVVQSMNQINQGARENTTGISQTKTGTEALNLAAQELKSIV